MIQEGKTLERQSNASYDLDFPIPSVDRIVNFPNQEKSFIEHIILSNKTINWRTFQYQFSTDNYESFLYAFALAAKKIEPSSFEAQQFSKNVRQLDEAIIRNDIGLRPIEEYLIKCCKSFFREEDDDSLRKEKLDIITSSLKPVYLGY